MIDARESEDVKDSYTYWNEMNIITMYILLYILRLQLLLYMYILCDHLQWKWLFQRV